MMAKTNSDTVAERRLRPIYDWLDIGNNKKAIQEADKVLKKQPDLLCAQVLKGLALLRSGKNKDCEEILENVQKKTPCDDCTLQAMTICYREIQKLEKICEIYEKAVLKDPHNEELNTHLFMSYVRIGDFKKQQQVALNLYKIKPKHPYYFWGVMSIVMQAQTADEKIAQTITLPLAERMVKKFIDEGKLEADQEIQLYLMILEMQKKYQEAIDVIDGDLGQRVMPYNMLFRKRMKLLQLLDRWKELNVYAKKMILEEPDAYNYYVIYIDSVFKLIKTENADKVDKVEAETAIISVHSFKDELLSPDYTIEECVAFIRRCQNDESKLRRCRGPYLASLFLFNKLSEEGCNPIQYLGTPLEIFKKYFEFFADKACCFKDLHQFLPIMQDEHESLLAETRRLINHTGEVDMKNKKQMMTYLTHVELMRYFDMYKMFSVDNKLRQNSKLIDLYNNGHRFNDNHVATDLGCSDTFIVLVAHSLFDLYLQTNQFKFIKNAICVLEYAYYYSPSNYHFKLLLLRFYNLLGASMAGLSYFQAMEIKHVQYDSLGYLECWNLLYSGQYSSAIQVLDNTLKFFSINYREAADQLTHAYKYGSFEKVNEFINFREKLKNSAHYNLVSIEFAIHELIHSPSHDITVQIAQSNSDNLEEGTPSLSHLVDNRDLSLFLCFDPDSRRMNEKYRKLTFEHDLSLIQLRSVILRCLKAALKFSSELKLKDTGDEHPHVNVKILEIFNAVIEELKTTCDYFAKNIFEELPKNILSGVVQSKYFLYVKSSFFLPFFVDVMELALEFCRYCVTCEPKDDRIDIKAENSLKTFSKIIKDAEQKLEKASSNCNETDHRDLFEFVSLVIEVTCVVSFICGVIHSVLLSKLKKVTPSKKVKKKGKDAGITNELTNHNKNKVMEGVVKLFSHFLNLVKDNIKLLDKNLLSCEGGWESLDIHEPGFELRRYSSEADQVQESGPVNGMPDKEWFQLQLLVNNNVRTSFRSSIKQFRNLVKNKLEYLSLLSF